MRGKGDLAFGPNASPFRCRSVWQPEDLNKHVHYVIDKSVDIERCERVANPRIPHHFIKVEMEER